MSSNDKSNNEFTDEEIKDISKSIVDLMTHFVDNGLTSMDQLNMCHTCGNIILNCKCENCQCNMHKAYRKQQMERNEN